MAVERVISILSGVFDDDRLASAASIPDYMELSL